MELALSVGDMVNSHWIIMYFIVRYGLLPETIELSHFVAFTIVGTVLTILMTGVFLPHDGCGEGTTDRRTLYTISPSSGGARRT